MTKIVVVDFAVAERRVLAPPSYTSEPVPYGEVTTMPNRLPEDWADYEEDDDTDWLEEKRELRGYLVAVALVFLAGLVLAYLAGVAR